jgi:hypothetical protein
MVPEVSSRPSKRWIKYMSSWSLHLDFFFTYGQDERLKNETKLNSLPLSNLLEFSASGGNKFDAVSKSENLINASSGGSPSPGRQIFLFRKASQTVPTSRHPRWTDLWDNR